MHYNYATDLINISEEHTVRARIDTLPSTETNTESKKFRTEWLRRINASLLVGAFALGLTGCKEDYYGTIEETRDVLSGSTITQCLDGGLYDLDGDGAKWSEEHFGQYYELNTNAIIEITPEAGGETLILEQTMNSGIRPEDLVISPFTDEKLLKAAGCKPEKLKEQGLFADYKVRANTKELKEHGMAPPE